MRYIETKTILSKLRTADRWFGIAYNMNLYRGCQHGCIYCDTRSDCYGIGDIAQIAVKRNALELLPAELRARRKKRATIGTGSMNDPYMPVERELRLTRRALGMIADERFPVHVITKASLQRLPAYSFHPNDNRATVVISREEFLRYLAAVGNTYEFIELY